MLLILKNIGMNYIGTNTYVNTSYRYILANKILPGSNYLSVFRYSYQ